MPLFKVYKSGQLNELYDANSLAALVKDSVQYYQEQAKEATERANKTYEEVKAQIVNEYEEENKRLRKDSELVWLRFSTSKEQEDYKKFVEKHKPCQKTSRANSGRWPYLIPVGTGLGTSLTVVCPICGEKEDITDIGAW